MPAKDEARRALIADLHAQGMDDVQIGARLGVSKSAICHTRKKMGLTPVKPAGRAVLVTEDQLREWSAAGLTRKQMVAKCGASPLTITRKLWEIRMKDERAAAMNVPVEDIFDDECDEEPSPEIVGDETFLSAFRSVRVALPTNSRRAETSNRDGRIIGLPVPAFTVSSIYGA